MPLPSPLLVRMVTTLGSTCRTTWVIALPWQTGVPAGVALVTRPEEELSWAAGLLLAPPPPPPPPPLPLPPPEHPANSSALAATQASTDRGRERCAAAIGS